MDHPSTEMVPHSPTDDKAPDGDAGGDHGGEISKTEEGDDTQGASPLGEDQPEKTETASVVAEVDQVTSGAVVVNVDEGRKSQNKSPSMKSVPKQLLADGLAEVTKPAGCSMPTPAIVSEDNTEDEVNIVAESLLDERGASETGGGRTEKQEVIVDGIILSESDTDASYSDNDAALDADVKDYVLHFNDSDQTLNVSEPASSRELNDVDGTSSAGKEKTRQVRESVGEQSPVVDVPSRPLSTKEEQEALCLAHGYELTEKTASKPYTRIHRGRVTQRKLESSVRIREMTAAIGHDLCAIKIIDKTKAPPQYLTKFLPREVKALRKVRGHAHVIQLYEFFHSGDFAYIVTEYCEGGTFLDYLNGHITRTGSGLLEAEARTFFKQLCSALSYCHNHNVIHRDLKCENILLDRNKNVKLSDFNYSKIVPELSLNSLLQTPCGSLSYAAPELFNAKSYDGQRADVWSMGVVLFSMLNGYLPFDESRVGEMQERMRTQRFTFVRGLSHEARLLLRSIMQWDPLKRPTVTTIEMEPWVVGRKLHPGERLYREQMEHKVFRKNTLSSGIRCNRSISSDDRVSQMIKTTATVTFYGHTQGAVVLKSRRPSREPRLHGGYSRFPPKMIERAQRLSHAINMRRRSLRRSSVEQGSGGNTRQDDGGSMCTHASQDVGTDGSVHRGSEDEATVADVGLPKTVYEGADGCLYTVVEQADVAPSKGSESPAQAEPAPVVGPSGETDDGCNDVRTMGVEPTDSPSQTRRLLPRFAATDSTVSSYGMRGSKLLQMMHDPHSGQFRRRLTMGMPIYPRGCSTMAPLRGQAKMMNDRREKVTLPEIQENDRTPAHFTTQLAHHYVRHARKPGIDDGESYARCPSYTTPPYDTTVPSLVPLVGSSVSRKHFDMVTLASSRKQRAGSREKAYTEAYRDNLPLVFHNMFPKWKKACRK